MTRSVLFGNPDAGTVHPNGMEGVPMGAEDVRGREPEAAIAREEEAVRKGREAYETTHKGDESATQGIMNILYSAFQDVGVKLSQAPSLSEENMAARVAWEMRRRGWSQERLAREMAEAGCPLHQSAISKI